MQHYISGLGRAGFYATASWERREIIWGVNELVGQLDVPRPIVYGYHNIESQQVIAYVVFWS